jgi:hypothetical protein
MQQLIAEKNAMADPDNAALEALATEKHKNYLLYHKKEVRPMPR